MTFSAPALVSRALRRARGWQRPLLEEARSAQRQRDWAAAEALWRRVVARDPKDAPAWVQLGNMLNELARREEAIAAFRTAGRLDPLLWHAPAGVAGVLERASRWADAEAAWEETIALLERRGVPDEPHGRQALAHAYAHAALSARQAGAPTRARAILKRAHALLVEIGAQAANLGLRASVLAPDDRAGAGLLLQDFVRLFPPAAGASPPATATSLRDGLAELAPALTHLRGDPAALRAALDLYEQVRLWGQAQQLAEWLATLEPGAPEHLERAFGAASARRNLRAARRIARRYATEIGEFLLIHQLLRLYEDELDLRRARLLCRFLMRRWPHSRWHVGHYISLTARTRSLDQADRLARIEADAGRRDVDVERAYGKAPFLTGSFAEAERRLRALLHRFPHDEEARVLLGYAIANATGLEQAEAYFAETAADTMGAAGPMIGLAHMAMRRRDLPATAERWGSVAAVHPGETVAWAEMARCAYEMRDQGRALALCEARLAAFPSDVTTGEFHAWLLTVNGRFRDAWDAIFAIRRYAGQSWALLELAVQCAGQLGTLREEWAAVLGLMPEADTVAASSRFYHVVRNLIVAGCPDLLPGLLERARLDPATLPWLHPYLLESGDGVPAATARAARRRWSASREQVGDAGAATLAAMNDADIALLLAKPVAELPTVHLVNKFEQPRGGSELHALDLAAAIGRHAQVTVWAPETPHPHFTGAYAVKGIDPSQGQVPRGGVLVFVGVYFDIAQWIAHARPQRVIFLYNTFEAPSLFARLAEVVQRTGVRAELLFCSDLMGRECLLPGRFEPSPTDLEEYAPAATARAERPFTLGRHSRDVTEKHHPEDWRVYRAVSDAGGRSRVLGGTCMNGAFPPVPGMDLLPARGSGIADYLRGLDAYFYRTSTWVEPWGRVVIEAMACGLPVLVHSVGGYAQVIEHEVNGLLFDSTDEAVRLVTRLAEEPALRARLGREARRTAERLLSDAEMRRLVAFYLIRPR